MSNSVIRILRAGDTTKPDPFTIAVISNPALETPWQSGAFQVDPVTSDQVAFDACASYIERSLFGGLPGQAEQFLSDPSIVNMIRLVSVFVTGLAATDANSLIGQDGASSILVPRRTRFAALLATAGITADVAYAVTKSATHSRAAAFFTSDDDASAGTPFTVDGVAMVHRDRCLIPGTVAIHATATSLTALHEFGHALSSYTNGMVVDLYVDSVAALNCRRARPIPTTFAVYDGTTISSDPVRDSLAYPPAWQSYHCSLLDPGNPALMDNYWFASPPEAAQMDAITRKFLLDRVRSKTLR